MLSLRGLSKVMKLFNVGGKGTLTPFSSACSPSLTSKQAMVKERSLWGVWDFNYPSSVSYGAVRSLSRRWRADQRRQSKKEGWSLRLRSEVCRHRDGSSVRRKLSVVRVRSTKRLFLLTLKILFCFVFCDLVRKVYVLYHRVVSRNVSLTVSTECQIDCD